MNHDFKDVPKLLYIRVKKYRENDQWMLKYKDMHLILLGEIIQCPGHGIVADLRTGLIHGMIHLADFEIVPEDEA